MPPYAMPPARCRACWHAAGRVRQWPAGLPVLSLHRLLHAAAGARDDGHYRRRQSAMAVHRHLPRHARRGPLFGWIASKVSRRTILPDLRILRLQLLACRRPPRAGLTRRRARSTSGVGVNLLTISLAGARSPTFATQQINAYSRRRRPRRTDRPLLAPCWSPRSVMPACWSCRPPSRWPSPPPRRAPLASPAADGVRPSTDRSRALSGNPFAGATTILRSLPAGIAPS